MINRLIQPNAGHIYIDGEDIAKQDKVTLRRRIGYVIQQIGLFPNMTVAQNICVVPKLLKYPKERCEQIVRDMLAMVDMPYEQYAHKYPPCKRRQGKPSSLSPTTWRKPLTLLISLFS